MLVERRASSPGPAHNYRVVFEHRRRHPAIEVECRDIFSNFQNEALRRQEIDVGFLRPPVDELNLDCEVLYEEDFVVILPKTHRLAKRRSVRLRDLAEEPLIGFNRKLSGLQDKMMGMFNRQGFAPHVVVTHVEAHEEAGAIMVATGKAIFVGPGAILNHSISGLELASLRLNEPEAKIQVYAAWRKGEDSPAVLGFLESVRAALVERGRSFPRGREPADCIVTSRHALVPARIGQRETAPRFRPRPTTWSSRDRVSLLTRPPGVAPQLPP
jgi:DNA-binding transcriptional LysR family regulator